MDFRTFRSAASVFLLVTLSSGLIAAEWHVAPPPLGDDSNPGTNDLPFAAIQHGIDAASSGDTVTVAEGTYQENVQFKGRNIVLTGTDPLNPDVIAKTIIQGRQLGPTVTFSGTENASCVLSGFTVWDGKWGNGGAIRGNGTHATIGMNVITGGTADSYGGGLYGCNGLIYLNVITVNSSGEGGGGLAFCNGPIQLNVISLCWSKDGGALYKCLGPIEDNTITDCVASGAGGGLFACDGDIIKNTIAKCSAVSGAGLAYCGAATTGARIANNTIAENVASSSSESWGGGLYGCDGVVENNVIRANTAGRAGGLFGCGGIVQNNLIIANNARGRYVCIVSKPDNQCVEWGFIDAYGGGLHSCNGLIRNNTIVQNRTTAVAYVGGEGLYGCSGIIQDCVVWGNTSPDSSQVDLSVEPVYSCIQDWTGGGEGNVALDPQFVDADGADNNPDTLLDNDYRLRATSPCIDTGKNQPWMWGALDLDGNNRIFFGGKSATVDMGAYEYNSFPFRIVEVRKTRGAQVQLKWSSRPGETYDLWSWSPFEAAFWWYEATVPSQGSLTTWTGASIAPQQRFYVVELR